MQLHCKGKTGTVGVGEIRVSSHRVRHCSTRTCRQSGPRGKRVSLLGLLRAGLSMAECRWAKTLAMAALLVIAGAGSPGFTQSIDGSLSGRLTDLDSKPLSGAAVVVRNQATGAEARSTTAKGGGYRFSGLKPGQYTLKAEIPGAGRGQVDGIVIAAGHESRVQAALYWSRSHPPPSAIPAAERQLCRSLGECRQRSSRMQSWQEQSVRPWIAPCSKRSLRR